MQEKISLMATQAKTVLEMAKSQTSPTVSRIKQQDEMDDFDLSQSVPEEMLFGNQSTGMMGSLAEDREHKKNTVNKNSMHAGGNSVAFDSNPVVNMSTASIGLNTIDTQANTIDIQADTIDLQADKFVESEKSVPQVEPIAVPIKAKKSTASQTKVFNTAPKV